MLRELGSSSKRSWTQSLFCRHFFAPRVWRLYAHSSRLVFVSLTGCCKEESMLAGDQGGAIVTVASSLCITRLWSSGIDSASVLNEDAIKAWRSRRGGIGPGQIVSCRTRAADGRSDYLSDAISRVVVTARRRRRRSSTIASRGSR